MALDFDLVISESIDKELLTKGICTELRFLLKVESPPVVVVKMIDGKTSSSFQVIGELDALYMLSFAHRDEKVLATVLTDPESPDLDVSIGVASKRNAAEITLAIAASLFLAKRSKVAIEDSFLFWNGYEKHNAVELENFIRIKGEAGTFDHACELLVGSRIE